MRPSANMPASARSTASVRSTVRAGGGVCLDLGQFDGGSGGQDGSAEAVPHQAVQAADSTQPDTTGCPVPIVVATDHPVSRSAIRALTMPEGSTV